MRGRLAGTAAQWLGRNDGIDSMPQTGDQEQRETILVLGQAASEAVQ